MKVKQLGPQGGDCRHLRVGQYIDLSTCVNRYGPPPAVIERIHSITGDEIRIHPYEAAEQLIEAHSSYLSVSSNQLVAGRGTTEFIWALARLTAEKKVLIPLPAYTDYLRAFPQKVFHDEPQHQENNSIHDSLVNCMAQSDFVVISNPNNPLGTTFDRSQLTEICELFPQTTLIVDESYVEFVPDIEKVSMIGSDLDNVVVLRSPSKYFGIAGARAGVAWSNNETLLAGFAKLQCTWPLSSLDVITAVCAIKQEDWARATRIELSDDAQWLDEFLQKLFEPDLGNVVKPVPVHYRFVYSDLALSIASSLQTHKILVRLLGADHGLVRPGLRISSPLKMERELFANVLSQVSLIF